MNRVASTFVAFGLAAAGSTALAAERAQSPPVLMTDDQMDNVTGAGVLDVVLADSLNAWNIDLQVKVLANVNAAVALVGVAQAQQGILSQTQVTGNLQ